MKCLNINNPQIQSELNKLTNILGDANAAYAVLALNNGYGLDKAPNGLESKLFQDIREALLSENSSLSQEELIKQTYLKKVLCYTPSFLDWFGDWIDNPGNASKVVDENGEPLMVYHGSPEVFNEFDLAFFGGTDPGDNGRGHYFAYDKEVALQYGINLMPVFLNIKNPYIHTGVATLSIVHGFNRPAPTKLESLEREIEKWQNILTVTTDPTYRPENWDSTIERMYQHKAKIALLRLNIAHQELLSTPLSELQQPLWDSLDTYDGVMESDPHYQLVVRNSNQIKSAIGNDGNFSESSNIYEEHEYQILNRKRDGRLLELYHKSDFLSHEAKWKKIIEDIIQPSPYRDLVQLLASFSSVDNRFLSEINIKFVDHLALAGPTSVLQSRGKFQGKRAYYDASTSTIYIDVLAEYNNGDSASVLMHEIMHGITVSRIINNEALKNKFLKILNLFKKFSPGFYYPSFDEHALEEFIADIWTNPEIIELLKQIPATKKSNISLWQRIVKFFLSVLFSDTHDGSLFLEASTLMVELLESVPTEEKLHGKYYENSYLSQDTKDILALQQYLYSIEGLTPDEISERQRAYLSQDPDEVQRVRKFLELIQIRQALLHTFNKDFGEELYINGVFDWNNYLLGIDLRKDITENQDLSAFSPIIDYVIDPAEIIMPKLYKTLFKLGTKDIADIDLNFFKRANPFYKSDLKSEGIPVDYLVRGHNFAYNIVVQDTLLFDHANWKPITPRIDGGWRLDNSGNRMYQVPEECKFALYINPKGQETLVILNEGLSDNYIKTVIETTNNRVSVHPFFENIAPTKSKLLDVVKWNHITTINGALKNLSRQVDLMEDSQIREVLNDLYIKRERQYKNDLANTLYNSFIKTLYLVSVRIPTQDFQSIMATKVVGLTNDDYNNVFVTRWLFWLLGSKQYYL